MGKENNLQTDTYTNQGNEERWRIRQISSPLREEGAE